MVQKSLRICLFYATGLFACCLLIEVGICLLMSPLSSFHLLIFFQLSQRDYPVLDLVDETVADRNLFLNTTTFADKAADNEVFEV